MAKVGMSARELACLPRVTTGWLQRADCEINPTLPVILGPRPPMLYRASQKGAYVFKFGGIMQPVERAALRQPADQPITGIQAAQFSQPWSCLLVEVCIVGAAVATPTHALSLIGNLSFIPHSLHGRNIFPFCALFRGSFELQHDLKLFSGRKSIITWMEMSDRGGLKESLFRMRYDCVW